MKFIPIMESEEYGKEEFDEVRSCSQAIRTLQKLAKKAKRLNDGVQRVYSVRITNINENKTR